MSVSIKPPACKLSLPTLDICVGGTHPSIEIVGYRAVHRTEQRILEGLTLEKAG
jgi:hypothetical protein